MSVQAAYTDAQNVILTIDVTPQDYKPLVEKELREYAKKANVPGFRPGKAPLGMVKRMAGKSIVLDSISNVVSNKLYNYVNDNKLDILGRPLPIDLIKEEEVDEECTKSISVSFELGLAPDFEVNLVPSISVPHYHVEVDEAFLDKEVANMRDRFGESVAAEVAEEGDWLFGRIELTADESVNALFGLSHHRADNPALFTPLLGMKLEDKRPYDLFALSSDINQLTKWFTLSAEEIEKFRGQETTFTLRRITRTAPAEINQAFFDKVLGAGTVDSEEKFREILKQELGNQLANESQNVFFLQAKKALLASNEVPLPDSFLKRWLLEEDKAKINEENIDTLYETYRDGFRWEMIVGKLERNNPGLVPTVKELDENIMAMIEHTIATNPQYGSDASALYNNLKKDKEFMDRQYNSLKEARLREFFENNIPHTHGHISASDFVKIEI